jgi:hypothetical protein
MKKLIFTFCAILIVIASCKKDDEAKANFIGNWQCDETSSVYGKNNFVVTIKEDANNATHVLIANFHMFGFSDNCYAIVTDRDIEIPSQSFCDNTISGRGQIDDKNTTIIWDYYLVGSGGTDTCSAILTKQ